MQSPVSTLVARMVVAAALRRPWPIFVAMYCCIATSAWAQSALTGIVHDPSGRVAVGATVTVLDTSGTHQWDTHASTIGYYEIELPPGEYRVLAELNDHQLTFSGAVRVFPNEKTALDIELQFRSQERVTVESISSPSAVNTHGALGVTFTREAIETLPLTNGRTLQSLISLVPGVVVTDSVGSLAQFTAAGQRRFSNRLTIDGVSADLAVDTRNLGISEAGSGSLPAMSTLGGTQTIVPMAAIEEIQVKTTNASPQDARTPGAQTIVVTRSGTNRFTADAFADLRPESLGAADWFANNETTVRGPASSLTGGASAGGPIVPRRVFYFAAWEHQRVNRPIAATIQVPSLASRDMASDNVQPLLEAFPIPNGVESADGLAKLSGDFPAVSSLSTFSLRVDASLSPSHRLFGRINIGNSTGDWLDTFQVPSTLFSNIESARTRTATLGLTSVSARFTNDLRINASVNRGSLIAGRSARLGTGTFPVGLLLPQGSKAGDAYVSVFDPAFSGTIASGRNAANSQKQVQVADTVSVIRGRHDWRFGLDARWATASADPAPEQYNYRFPSVADLLHGQVRLLTVQDAAPISVLFTNVSAFAEDAFRVGPRLSLRYGLRYSIAPAPSSRTAAQPMLLDINALPQVQALPTGTQLWKTSWRNLAPQVNATYQLSTSTGHETSIRAGWSLAFDDLTNSGGTVFGRGYPYTSTRVLSSPVLPVPESVWSTEAPALFAPTDRNIYYAFHRNYRSPKTYSWQVGIDQALGAFQRLGVAYAGSTGRDLSYWYAYGARVQVPVRLWTVNAFSNAGSSDYHALLAEYVWRLSHGFQAQINYTWSHAIDLDSGEMITANPPPAFISPRSNRASADYDRRHVLQAVVSYQLPKLTSQGFLRTLSSNWQVDAVVAARSGAPFTVSTNREIDGAILALRPDAVAGVPVWIRDPTAPTGRQVNPAAFEIPTAARQGTLGRNALRASPLRQVDLGISRSLRLGERVVARLRIDAFNVFNISNFGPPVADLAVLPTFGRPTKSYASALGSGTLTRGGLVPIQQLGGPRSVQIGVRISF